MDQIRIQNLRGLRDTGLVELKPITLLVGENSSGKSTFLRVFPLLRQSVESRTRGPILWYGRLVDFGSFSDALRRDSDNRAINFEFGFTLPTRFTFMFRRRRPSSSNQISSDLSILFEASLAESTKQSRTRVEFYKLEFYDHSIKISLANTGKIKSFVVNGRELTDSTRSLELFERSGLFPMIRQSLEENMAKGSGSSHFLHFISPFREELIKNVRKYARRNTGLERIDALINDIQIDSSEKMLERMRLSKRATETWKKNADGWTIEDCSFRLVRDLIIADWSLDLLEMSDRYISSIAENTTYIAPLRATAERYYRFQDLAVDEVDFQGQNLAMFLRDLGQVELKEYQEWMSEHLGFKPIIEYSSGHLSIELNEAGSDISLNLADLGFGFSQILPVATQLWWQGVNERRRLSVRSAPVILAIEQPELHLHPRLQARFADAVVAILKSAKQRRFPLTMLIETHSEAIVNRLGHKVSNGDVEKDDISIVLFDRFYPGGDADIRIGGYDEEGYLINWPFGFFEPDVP